MNSLSKLMSILLVFSLVFCMFSVSSEAVSANLVDKLKRDKWYEDGRVAPAEGASRAQIASIIMRMDQQGMFNKA